MYYRNDIEVRVWGLARSGNHAIISWLASLFDEPVWFFNCIESRRRNLGVGDPYRTRWDTISYFNNDAFKDVVMQLPSMRKWPEEKLQKVRKKHKHCIIYSHEWCHFDIMKRNGDSILDRNYTIGKSKKQYDVLIVRDIYNWWASVISYAYDSKSKKSTHEHRKESGYYLRWLPLWEMPAREFEGSTNYLPFELVCISFNEWIKHRSYRRMIAKKFGLPYSERFINFPAKQSSHVTDGINAKNRLGVLSRYKQIKKEDYGFYWNNIEKYPKLLYLSDKLFGSVLKD